ncbi:MAG: Dna2/Cas4 domain-containing protein [Methanomicrobiaceae archaeon]|nr:Dna2/Cas4 domain-containing protein [Methanomicrobiaceae archaeon]
MHESTISVSAVVSCHRCPVRFFLERSIPGEESHRYTLAKQISYHLGRPLDPAPIWEEIRTVSPAIDTELGGEFIEWVERCAEGSFRMASEHDVPVKSARLRVHGVVDRIFAEEPFFAIVRSSQAPPAGIYTADRIRIACLSAAVEETLGLKGAGGLVEYIPSGVARVCTPQPRDRRAALRAIRAAHRVAAGEIPDRPTNPPCETCHLRELCNAGPKTLAGLL